MIAARVRVCTNELEGASARGEDYYHLGLPETARRYGIQHVVTNTWDADRFTNDAFDPALIAEYSYADRRRFYREMQVVGRLVPEFSPACENDVGVRI